MVSLSELGYKKIIKKMKQSPTSFNEDDYNPNYVQWSTSDGSLFFPASKTTELLPPGVYEIDSNPNAGLFFEKIKKGV